MTDIATDIDVDLLDPELYRRNPHDVWTRLRRESPVYHDDKNGLWGITRHADVLDVERRSHVFSSQGNYRAIPEPLEVNMIAQDDPRHGQQRKLVQRRFTPKAVEARRPELDALVEELVAAALAGGGEVEVVEQLAAQLPSRLTARLLGLPEDEWPTIKSWSERLMRIDSRNDPEILPEVATANIELFQRVQELVPERQGCPADDLISTWATAEIEGEPLDLQTVYHETGLFVAGGAETTRTAIAHGLRAFCDHPDQWDLLASDPSVVPTAVEEVLRWVTPLNNFFRVALADDQVGGQPIAAGDRVILLYPSANRDEAVFGDPFRFDVTRSPNPHVAFGQGTHFCVGANLARQTLASLFTALAARITNLRPVSEPDVEPNIFARAVRSFRLGFDLR